ncbi:adenosine deaminase [Pseudomonas fulva]|uniref:adenosine deaminase n=1 Tax=Pseudomonas fulva TaxID=47880 RepID=UPI001E49D5EC|nr:adenosine deaminase [Pseudomonas fulva]
MLQDNIMYVSTELECFQAWELVSYSKAVFMNGDLLRLVEGELRVEHRTNISSIYIEGFTKPQLDSWLKIFSQGRFTQLSRLHPKITDDVLEKRLARIVRAFSLEDMQYQLPILLNRLADTFLCEGRDGSIRVHTRLLEPWQALILVVPPLLISAAWIAKKVQWSGYGPQNHQDRENALDRFQRWLCDSTLPVDNDPFLDHLCRTQGLDETHMHLNGTTESEKVWCDALVRPKRVVGGLTGKKLSREFGLHASVGNGVDRLLRQEDQKLSPTMLMRRVEDAMVLKAMLLNMAMGVPVERDALGTEAQALTFLNEARQKTLPCSSRRLSVVVSEAWQLTAIMTGFNNNSLSNHLGCAFWHYALIRSQFCRLLVQQAHHKGFDQFQYITLNELREATEQEYAERFRQIERGHQQVVDFLEGRFAPKNDPDKTAALIGRILRGYLQFLSEDESGQAASCSVSLKYRSLSELLERVQELEKGHARVSRSARRLRLGLVPHFIKQTTINEHNAFFSKSHVRPLCRHSRLRRDTDLNARALVILLQRTIGLSGLIRGIDAASNERHAGPEVFAPVFRRMRAAGVRRFTYHVGEDFTHLASGLRAIGEALSYLDLDAGCRIGHGTAAGVNPKKWWEAVQGYVVLPLEERLDDLVFAWDTLLHSRNQIESLTLIETEIRHLAMRIWQDPFLTPEVLVAEWKLRALDPLAIETKCDDVDPNRREEAQRHRAALDRHPAAYAQFMRRHGIGASAEQLKRCQEEVVVSRETDVIGVKVLRALQQAILKRLDECTIAIETLPSSNVRISIHEVYDQHHSINWLGLGKRPMQSSVSVVAGSDDPGIFATGLRHEYAHLLRVLRSRANSIGDPSLATTLIQRVCTDAKRFRF